MNSIAAAAAELHKTRMELAAALRTQAAFLEQLATAAAMESALRVGSAAPLAACREADRAVAGATVQRGEGEARLDALYKQERAALQQWIAAVAVAP